LNLCRVLKSDHVLALESGKAELCHRRRPVLRQPFSLGPVGPGRAHRHWHRCATDAFLKRVNHLIHGGGINQQNGLDRLDAQCRLFSSGGSV
jgi:hypothetical protein